VITGVHFLLTYMCNLECDHCFVYSGPYAKGTFTLEQIRQVLAESQRLGTVERIYFEGGEPFLYYPVMLEGLRIAKKMGFQIGVVTNAYWVTSVEDAELWLRPLLDLGISDLSVSDDAFHFGEEESPAKLAAAAADRLGIPVGSICIEKPVVGVRPDGTKGEPVVEGGALLKGRAVETLAEGLPTRPSEEFTECPEEDLEAPGRVHVDPYGYVHLCQGLVMGNLWETPFSDLARTYSAESHPVCGPLVAGGPTLLAQRYEVAHAKTYASACHFCYSVRRALADRFPAYLAPRQVYGFEESETT
jgi:MoaA/NifB/PqqE/SkfB family radical SAM enzyme